MILEIIYARAARFPQYVVAVGGAGILLLFSVLLADLAPVLLFPIFYKFAPLARKIWDW